MQQHHLAYFRVLLVFIPVLCISAACRGGAGSPDSTSQDSTTNDAPLNEADRVDAGPDIVIIDSVDLQFQYLNDESEWNCEVYDLITRIHGVYDAAYSDDKKLVIVAIGISSTDSSVSCILTLTYPLLNYSELTTPTEWVFDSSQETDPRRVISVAFFL